MADMILHNTDNSCIPWQLLQLPHKPDYKVALCFSNKKIRKKKIDKTEYVI
jgi:hypothetical protein